MLIFRIKRENYIFLGISDYSKAYKLYNHSTKKIIVIHDVIFYEAESRT
jgi:hypothetical protein